MKWVVVFLLAWIFAIARLAGVRDGVFQAVAHLFVGCMIGAQIAIYFFGARRQPMAGKRPLTEKCQAAFFVLLGTTVLLCIVELFAALVLFPLALGS